MLSPFTFIIYLGLLLYVLILTTLGTPLNVSRRHVLTLQGNRNLNIAHWAGLLFISFIAGFRYNVGVDWWAYKRVFENLQSSSTSSIIGRHMEIGYIFINKAVIVAGGSYSLMFFIVALFSWFFVFKSVPAKLLPLTLFFLFTDEFFFWSMNGVRQFIAISIFLFSLKFIISRSFLPYICFILFASLFHSSVLILLPIYFVPFEKLYSHKIWIIIFCFTLVFNNTAYLNLAIETALLQLANYSQKIEFVVKYTNHKLIYGQELSYGAGYYFRSLITFFIFLVSKKIIDKHPASKLYFVFFFFGAVLSNIFIEFQLVNRILIYFTIFRPFVLAVIVYEFWRRKTYFISVGICTLYIILFLSAIYNSSNQCAPYNFSFLN